MKGGVRSTFHGLKKRPGFVKGGFETTFIVNGSGLASVFYVRFIRIYPHALVHRLISEADISAGFATSLRLVLAQLLRLAETKS